MQVIIGKVLIFSPKPRRKVPPSLFPVRRLYFNQKQTAKTHPGRIELTLLAASQEVHYGKTTSAHAASPFLALTEVTVVGRPTSEVSLGQNHNHINSSLILKQSVSHTEPNKNIPTSRHING